MCQPERYSSDEYLDEDEDDIEFYSYKSRKPVEITEDEKRSRLRAELMKIITQGDVEEALSFMKEHELPIDIELNSGWTPLLLAAGHGLSALAKALIDKGANVNQTKDDCTVLLHACSITSYNSHYNESLEIVKYLVEHKADTTIVNKTRMNAFLCAAHTGNIPVVSYLMPYFDLNCVDNQGWDALFFAVNDNHVDLVQFLLSVGINYKRYDCRRITALDYARMRDLRKICDLIPSEERQLRKYQQYIAEHYDYAKEIKDPKFLNDVKTMLIGMKCGNLIDRCIAEENMNLLKFLTLQRSDLTAMNITRPFQQNLILSGLFRFHRHPYKYHSIVRVQKDKQLSTYDVRFIFFCAMRHFVAMHASLKYLQLNAGYFTDDALTTLEALRVRLQVAEDLVQGLVRRCEQWDKDNVPVDLITYPPKKTRGFYVFALPIIGAITIITYFKYRV